MAKRGRPKGSSNIYTAELASAICEQLAAGESLNQICAAEGMPPESTVRTWAIERREFSAKYAGARKIGIDCQAEGIIRIADDKTLDPNARRVMIDARKWLFSKMRPDKYGDRVELAGDPNAPLIPHVVVEFVGAKKPE